MPENTYSGWSVTFSSCSTTTATGDYSRYLTPREEREEERFLRAERDPSYREARKRAKRKLRQHLTHEQWVEYECNGTFLVRSATGKVFRLRDGWIANVEELNADGKQIHAWCAHVPRDCPVEDNLLAQLLYLTASEETESEFLRRANKHW